MCDVDEGRLFGLLAGDGGCDGWDFVREEEEREWAGIFYS